MTDFSIILGNALQTVAAEHGLSYADGGAQAWGRTGAAYISYSFSTMSAQSLRSLQATARELTGPVLLDCKWYDRMATLCLDRPDRSTAVIPQEHAGASVQTITESLFMEMLDFLREG